MSNPDNTEQHSDKTQRSELGKSMADNLVISDGLPTIRKRIPALITSIAIAIFCMLASPQLTHNPRAASPERSHAVYAIEFAFLMRECNDVTRWPAYEELIAKQIIEQPALRSVPLQQIRDDTQGDAPYCQHRPVTMLLWDPGLGQLINIIITLSPTTTMQDLERILSMVRLALVTVCTYLVLRLGGGLLFAAIGALLSVSSFGLLAPSYVSSAYLFIAPFAWLLSILAALMARNILHRGLSDVVISAAMFAIAASLAGSFRTSLLFISAGLFVFVFLYVLLAMALRRHDRPKALRMKSGVAAMVTTAAIFFPVDHFMTAQHEAAVVNPKTGELSYNTLPRHNVAHMLILGIVQNNERSELATRENLHFRDRSVYELTKRLDPEAPRNSPRSEELLFKYYFDLLREHPGEFVDIYYEKLNNLQWIIKDWGQKAHNSNDTFVRTITAPFDFLSFHSSRLMKNGVLVVLSYLLILGTLLGMALWLGLEMAIVLFFGTLTSLAMIAEMTLTLIADTSHYYVVLNWQLLCAFAIFSAPTVVQALMATLQKRRSKHEAG